MALKVSMADFSPYPRTPPQQREKPMKVLCLGLSRTGTMSTYHALCQLGFPCYHMAEPGRQLRNGALKRWREAIEAKYFGGKGRKLERAEEFDELLWQYEAISDIPCVLFANELLTAYPDAKVILTERDPDAWLASIQRSFHEILGWRFTWTTLQLVDWQFTRDYIPVVTYPLHIWSKGEPNNPEKLKKGYLEHNAHIRAIVPKERLLVWHPRQGWEPLCKFLGVKVPEGEFPRINEGGHTADIHWDIFVPWRTKAVLSGFVRKVVPVVGMGVAWWAYGRFG